MSGTRGSKKSIWDTRFGKQKKALAFDECLKVAGFTADEWKTIKGAKVEIGEGGEILHGMKGKFKNINDIPRKTVKQREGENIEQTEERAREVFARQDAEKQTTEQSQKSEQQENQKPMSMEERFKAIQEQQRARSKYLEEHRDEILQKSADRKCQASLKEMQNGFYPRYPRELGHTLNSEQATSSLASIDNTGFCASYCLAYVGLTQMGLATEVGRYSTRETISKDLCNLMVAAGGKEIVRDTSDWDTGKKTTEIDICRRALDSIEMEPDKEYVFVGGTHAAMVRLSQPYKNGNPKKDKYEFLELQSYKEAGWHGLSDKQLTTRFGVDKKAEADYYSTRAYIVESGKLAQYSGTRERLPYVNNMVYDEMKEKNRGGVK